MTLTMAKHEMITVMKLSDMDMILFLPLISGHLHLGNLEQSESYFPEHSGYLMFCSFGFYSSQNIFFQLSQLEKSERKNSGVIFLLS